MLCNRVRKIAKIKGVEQFVASDEEKQTRGVW